MAIQNLAAIVAALPQSFDDKLSRLWNREARLLKYIPTKRGMGQNCAFVVNVGGATADSFSDGYDVQALEYASDTYLPATLNWAQYRSSFTLSQRAIDAAASASGGAEALLDLFTDNIFNSVSAVMSKLNSDLDAGPGTSDRLLGLDASLISSGSYAGISATTYPLIKSNIMTSVGALTSANMAAMETLIFKASGKMPDLIVMTPELHEKYSILGQGVTNNVQGVKADRYNLSVRDDQLFWKGIPVIRDKDMIAGTVKFLNTDDMHIKILPPVPSKDSVLYQVGAGQDGVNSTGLPVVIEALAKSGPSQKFSVRTPSMQLVIPRGNSMGIMKGVS